MNKGSVTCTIYVKLIKIRDHSAQPPISINRRTKEGYQNTEALNVLTGLSVLVYSSLPEKSERNNCAVLNKGPTNASKYQWISKLVHSYMFRRFKAPSAKLCSAFEWILQASNFLYHQMSLCMYLWWSLWAVQYRESHFPGLLFLFADIWKDYLEEESVCRKASTYTRQEKHRRNWVCLCCTWHYPSWGFSVLFPQL
jgi:hypothetical protein